MSDLQIPEPVAGFIDTVNAHDDQGFLDAFTPGGVVDDWGREFQGREAIRTWSDKEFIGASGVLTPEEITVDGNDVTIVGDWRSTHANGRSSFAFVIDGDKLSRMTIREG